MSPTPEQKKRYNRVYRLKHPEAIKRSAKKYREMNKEKIKIWDKNYLKTPQGKLNRHFIMKRYREKHPIKHTARWITRKAINSGKIQKQPCEVCGNKKSQAHHLDYYKPLEVKWLCLHCHRIEHARAEGKE